ncbi:hypothetical protein [uncultured Dialister sp.]|uniref:hypothetical protein n=1 Tax=uncultured Dialister sp. TaxID=278064 RepID=UPI0027DE52C5|nr:hypothetical protein [uncultured Dialister sp.]
MNMEEMKERAKYILRDYEERKKRLADRISYLESLEVKTTEDMDEWKAKELYAIDLNNEAETAFDTITDLGIMSTEEACEYTEIVKFGLKLPDEDEESDEPG